MVDNTQKEKAKSPTQLEMEPYIIIHYRVMDTIPTPSPPAFVGIIVTIPPCTYTLTLIISHHSFHHKV